MKIISNLWLSLNRKYRVVKVQYCDNTMDIQVEELGPWPKYGAPLWRSLCVAEIRELPKYVQLKYQKFIAASKK